MTFTDGYSALLEKSRQEFERQVPNTLRGWTNSEYREHCKNLIGKIGGIEDKPGILAAIKRGDHVQRSAVSFSVAAYRQHGQNQKANELEEAFIGYRG